MKSLQSIVLTLNIRTEINSNIKHTILKLSYCPQCGHANSDEFTYCSKCGTDLTTTSR